MKVHGWVWTMVGSLMLLGLAWVRPNDATAPTLAAFGLGALDVAAGTLTLRRMSAGRWLLMLAVLGHLVLAVWLGYRAHLLADSLAATPTARMSYEEMVGQTAGQAMLGMVVSFAQGLVMASVLLCGWTAYGLSRRRADSGRP